jgi:hypothetical protein
MKKTLKYAVMLVVLVSAMLPIFPSYYISDEFVSFPYTLLKYSVLESTGEVSGCAIFSRSRVLLDGVFAYEKVEVQEDVKYVLQNGQSVFFSNGKVNVDGEWMILDGSYVLTEEGITHGFYAFEVPQQYIVKGRKSLFGKIFGKNGLGRRRGRGQSYKSIN